jgi:hypothetical protein
MARNNGCGRPEKNFNVEPEGPGANVLQIQTNHVIEMRAATTFDLPESGDPGLNFLHTAPMPYVVSFELVLQRRTWSHKRHVSNENIPKLWQLIKTRLA